MDVRGLGNIRTIHIGVSISFLTLHPFLHHVFPLSLHRSYVSKSLSFSLYSFHSYFPFHTLLTRPYLYKPTELSRRYHSKNKTSSTSLSRLSENHHSSTNICIPLNELRDSLSKPLSLRASLTPKVLTVTASYVTMAVFYMAFSSILPLFYATPIEFGGLSLDPPRIGAILAVSGVAHSVFQLLFYARLHDRFGAGAIHTAGVSSGIPIVILFPVINVLARVHGMGLAVWSCVAAQHVLTTSLMMCNPCLALFIRAAAPNRASLGATNGIAQMVAAGARIIAPASATSVFSYSMQEGHDAWLVYYFLMVIAFLAVGTSLLLPRDPSLWEDRQQGDP